MVGGRLSTVLKQEINSRLPELVEFRRDLHRHPELSGEEQRTAGKLEEALTSYGYEVRRVGGTGLYTTLESGKPGPDIILRADIDALPISETSHYPYPSEHPGVMHACGHDVHATALLGAARYLAVHRQELQGKIRFIFQHAEEKGHGSQDFLKEGLHLGAERIYGFHVCPEAKLGTVVLADSVNFASCDYLKVELFGRNSHIARPHLGKDAALCAADLVLALHTIRETMNPLDPVLVGIGKVASGSAWNILSDHAEIEGTLRAFSVEARQELIGRAEEAIRAVSERHGIRAETRIELNAPCLVNHPEANRTMQQVAEQTVGDGNVLSKHTPFGFGADDFAAFSQVMPGSFLHIGTAVEGDPDSALSLHDPSLFIPDETVGIGCEVLIRCALWHLESN